MRYLLSFFIVIYQKLLSRDTGFLPKIFGVSTPTCIFYPTCSEYSKEAILKYGSIKGIILSAKRVARCNPFNEPKIDLLPEKYTLSFRRKVR